MVRFGNYFHMYEMQKCRVHVHEAALLIEESRFEKIS